jgi:hypothetical protein
MSSNYSQNYKPEPKSKPGRVILAALVGMTAIYFGAGVEHVKKFEDAEMKTPAGTVEKVGEGFHYIGLLSPQPFVRYETVEKETTVEAKTYDNVAYQFNIKAAFQLPSTFDTYDHSRTNLFFETDTYKTIQETMGAKSSRDLNTNADIKAFAREICSKLQDTMPTIKSPYRATQAKLTDCSFTRKP